MNVTDVQDLQRGMDLRRPEYRRETFMRFYLHTAHHGTFPGMVYTVMPWLRDHYSWSDEQALWFAFLNGNTQNVITSLLLMQHCDDPTDPDALEDMIRFFEAEWARLPFDTDRRHQKRDFPMAVRGYCDRLGRWGGSQAQWWLTASVTGWSGVWREASALYGFGRLSAFSYAEYLRIMGISFDCDDLLIGDMAGSHSHRTGLMIVDGDDAGEALRSKGACAPRRIVQLEALAAGLLSEARHRAAPADRHRVSYFTLESALCTYKSWHKPRRRYPNVYADMHYDRIKQAERLWSDHTEWASYTAQQIISDQWSCRARTLPGWLRLEDRPQDPGLSEAKQNHYLTTGHTVMLGHEDPALWSEFDAGVVAGAFGVRADVAGDTPPVRL